MNLERAGTEAFVRFLEFESSFDRSFKFSIAALRHMEKVVGGPGGPTIIRGLIADAGANWRDDDGWKEPVPLVRQCVNDACLLGLVQIHSAVDDFVVTMQADLARWASVSSPAGAPVAVTVAPDDSDSDPLEKLCQRRGWGCAAFDQLRPVLGFLRTMRNCVAHRSGLASAALVRQRSEPALQEALGERWNGRVDERALPFIALDQRIELEPRAVILALEAARRACAHVNGEALATFRAEGLVFMAAHHALLADDPEAAGSAYISADSVVNNTLSSRYRVRDVGAEASIQTLQKLGLWRRCVQRHGELYRDRPRPVGEG